jgi:hypothetical protein
MGGVGASGITESHRTRAAGPVAARGPPDGAEKPRACGAKG